MKRSMLLASLAIACACTQNSPQKPVASVAQDRQGRTAMAECPPGPCVVTVTVDAATCAVTASPSFIMVHKPSDMRFTLQTPGWQFASGRPIDFKNPPGPGRVLPGELFKTGPTQSGGPPTVVIHNRYDIDDPNKDKNDIGSFPYGITVVKDDGSKTCAASPVLVVPDGSNLAAGQTFSPVVANN